MVMTMNEATTISPLLEIESVAEAAVVGDTRQGLPSDFSPGIEAVFPDQFQERDCVVATTGDKLPDFLPGAYYLNGPARFGFGDDDFADGGNDRLVDTICAWGDLDAVAARVRAHLDAGADHVAVQVLVDDRRGLPRKEWAELAPALLAL